MLSIFYYSASNAFIQVGSFVALTLLLFGTLNLATNGCMIRYIQQKGKYQVILGALLGLTPGCGGAILIMPLFLKGYVTFGTIIATLIATMGDAAFVLMISLPRDFLFISVISFLTALVSGYTIDFLKIGSQLNKPPLSEQTLTKNKMFQPEDIDFRDNSLRCSDNSKHIDIPTLNKVIYLFRHHIGFVLFWILALASLPLGIMNLMQINLDQDLPIKNLSIIGFLGTLFSILYSVITKKIIADDTLPEIKSKQHSIKETLIHNAEETAFVVMWVFIALYCYELLVYFLGGVDFIKSLLAQHGYMMVIVALLIGLIPGCGPHIILTGLYIQGILPFSALIANAISNDGDALFPLLAMDKKSAFFASIYSTIPAVIVGTIFYLLGF
ncbi:MAG: putative manganese transporter [Brevinema sp.]